MGQAQPAFTPPSLRILTSDRSRFEEAPQRAFRGRRALVTVIFGALMGLGYLCALVRVSELDLACQQLREECSNAEAELGALAIARAALIEGSKIDRVIADGQLEKPVSHTTAAVSPELCPSRDRFADSPLYEQSTAAGSVQAGMNGSQRW